MNTSRINALAAKAMGWEQVTVHRPPLGGVNMDYLAWDTGEYLPVSEWVPASYLPQAFKVLEHVADGRDWSIRCVHITDTVYYGATIDTVCGNSAKSLCEAILRCTLNASPLITDDELNEALKD